MIARPITVFGLMLVFVSFNGCTVLPERDARSTFMLSASELTPGGQSRVPQTLRLLTPQAETPLNSANILVNPSGQAIHTYAGARWSKPAPVLVRDHLIEGLRQSGAFKAIVNETSDARSDLSLASDLTRFQMHYDQGQATIVIQLDVQLLESNSRQVLAAEMFEVRQPVAKQPVESVIEGFGAASQIMTENLVTWLRSVSPAFHEGQKRHGRLQEKDPAMPPSDTEPSTRE